MLQIQRFIQHKEKLGRKGSRHAANGTSKNKKAG